MTTLSAREQDLLERVQSNEDLRPLFFRKVKGLRWFGVLKNAGYFDPREHPSPTPPDEDGYLQIPHWRITDYLVKTAPEIAIPEHRAYAKEFLAIITEVTDYTKNNGFTNYRTWWKFAQVIFFVPPELISADDLRVVDYWLEDPYERGLVTEAIGEKWLPALFDREDPHSHHLALTLLGIIFKVSFVDRDVGGLSHRDAVLRADVHRMNELVDAVAHLAGRRSGRDALEVFDRELRRVLTELDSDRWSSIWQPAIEDHEQNRYRDDTPNLLIKAYRECLAGYISTAGEAAIECITSMIEDQYQTIQRLAIHAVGNNFWIFRELTAHLIQEKYFEDNFRHEMWCFLNHNYGRFTAEEREKVRQLILGISRTDEDGHVHQGASAYLRATWFAALRDHGAEERGLYHEHAARAGTDPERPSFSSYTSVDWVSQRSPIPLEELQAMETGALIDTLSSYADNEATISAGGIGALSDALRKIVKASPLQFYTELHRFIELDTAYAYQVIEAYRELWAEKAKLPWDDIWDALLSFCESIIQQHTFWNDSQTNRHEAGVANSSWVICAIGRLIAAGTQSDDHAFHPLHMNKAEQIIDILLRCVKGSDFTLGGDAVSVAINSPRGQSLEALINVSLRRCRLADIENDGDHTGAWEHYRPTYESELARSRIPEYEFRTLVTNYLPNFLYMSKDWVLSRLDSMFDCSDHLGWTCAMQGYGYVGRVFEEIYRYLKDNGHFLRALDDEYLGSTTKQRIIQNIGVAFLANFEDIEDEDSLIKVLISRGSYDELSHLIWFFWTQRNKKDERVKSKIFELWPRVLEVTDTSSKDGRRLASQLCHWSAFVGQMNSQSRNLLLAVAPFADVAHNAYEMLRNIAVISARQPFEAHEIWMRMLEFATPDYPQEAIQEILRNLVAQGPDGVRKANEAVDVYLKVANDGPAVWLRQILEGEL
jgi:hypothetical protein